MNNWVNFNIIHRFTGISVLLFVIFGALNKAISLYNEIFFRLRYDWIIILVLFIGLFLQLVGGFGVIQFFMKKLRNISFLILYFVSGFELSLYASSAILIRATEICDTVVTARGGDPVRLTIGQVCFLILLCSFHWTDKRV